uniref:Uncharacterized protein n=1 Tax=Rhizophora mucronata TaxID=61149 RepID=A0A2P2N8P0_RHIMU
MFNKKFIKVKKINQ